MTTVADLTLDDVEEARIYLRGIVRNTALLADDRLDEIVGAQVIVKSENQQKTGSFKFRGLAYKIHRLAEATQGPRELVIVTSGNAGQAAALAAKMVGWTCTVISPSSAAVHKVAASAALGARIVDGGADATSAFATAQRYMTANPDAISIHAFDDIQVLRGHGTLALEMQETLANLDAVIIPASGGGLLGGVAAVVKQLCPQVKVFAAQPTGSDALRRSLEAGVITPIESARTIADGLVALAPGKIPFAFAREYVDGVLMARDATIRRAVAIAWTTLGQALEPAGATAIAAALDNPEQVRGARVAIVASGGNVDLNLLRDEVRHRDSKGIVV